MIKFEWKDNTLLYVSFDDFENRKYYFNLRALDKYGFYIEYRDPVLFAFYISPQPKIYSLDLDTKELAELNINFPQDILWDHPYFEIADRLIKF